MYNGYTVLLRHFNIEIIGIFLNIILYTYEEEYNGLPINTNKGIIYIFNYHQVITKKCSSWKINELFYKIIDQVKLRMCNV